MMRMRMKDGYVQIIEADHTQAAVFKSWGGMMKWNKRQKWWEGLVCAELLNRLAELIPLPKPLDAERCRLNAVQKAVDAERVRPPEDLKPLVKYPVKRSLYAHQVRAANMALLTFGLAEVSGVTSPDASDAG